MRADRRIIDLEDEMDRVRANQRNHQAIIRPNRNTRYDADLVSRREMREYIEEYVDGIVTDPSLVLGSGGGSIPMFEDLTPVGDETGTTWSLSETPASGDTVAIFLNGTKLRLVNSAPTASQFIISGTTVTTGRSLIAGERLEAIYQAIGERLAFENLTPNLTETGATWVLSETPIAGKIALFLNGTKLRLVESSPTASQFTIADDTITTGRTLVAGERLEAIYAW